jgi:hypothetical protein
MSVGMSAAGVPMSAPYQMSMPREQFWSIKASKQDAPVAGRNSRLFGPLDAGIELVSYEHLRVFDA